MSPYDPKDQKMTDKEKADCLLQLHRDRLEKFKQTRDLEFKVNLALWSFIILAGYNLKQPQLYHCITCFTLLYLIIGLLITILHYHLWLQERISKFYL